MWAQNSLHSAQWLVGVQWLCNKGKNIRVWSPFYRQGNWGLRRLTCLTTSVSITVLHYKQQKPTPADWRKGPYGKPVGECTESPGKPRLIKWTGIRRARWRSWPRPRWCLRSSLGRTWLTSPCPHPLPPSSRGHYQHDTATITGSGYQTSLLRQPASPEGLFYCPYFFAAPASVGNPWVHLIGCDWLQGKLGKWMSGLLRFYTLRGVCLTPELLVGESLEQEDLVLGRKK